MHEWTRAAIELRRFRASRFSAHLGAVAVMHLFGLFGHREWDMGDYERNGQTDYPPWSLIMPPTTPGSEPFPTAVGAWLHDQLNRELLPDERDPSQLPTTTWLPVGGMTKTKFDQIQPGMTRDQVTAIVGGPGRLQPSDAAGDLWTYGRYYSDAPHAGLVFLNGRLTTKSEFGLTDP